MIKLKFLIGFIISRKNWRKFSRGCQLFSETFRDFKISDPLGNILKKICIIAIQSLIFAPHQKLIGLCFTEYNSGPLQASK